MSRRVAVIGYGAIGSALVDGLGRSSAGSFVQAVLLRRHSARRSLPAGVEPLSDVDELIRWEPDLVVEAAGGEALRAFAAPCLKRALPFLACSAGALSDDALFAALVDAAREGGSRLLVPSGAVASLDYIAAIAGLPDARVVYESRKPPAAWRDMLTERGQDPERLREPFLLFEGAAREAAALFPQNLNVAATLALAGIGMDMTKVRVVVDPAATGNTHTITATSAAGELRTQLVNRASPTNPKTSLVTALSAIAAIERFFAPVAIG